MRTLSILVLFYLVIIQVYSQETNPYQKGLTSEQNLKAIANLAPYSPGGIGFDNRYEGIKGSSRLFDKLLPSFLRIKGQDYYLQLNTDIDIFRNRLIFNHPTTGKLLSIPADIVIELIVTIDGKEQIFRTTGNKKFEKDVKDEKFYQVLKEGPYQFIKMPLKVFIEADYKNLYSVDRRYDEYDTKYRYYILCSDSTFHQLQLNKKSLMKLFPDKKNIIDSVVKGKSYSNDEEMVQAVLNKF
jgi:hypothetical protein